MLREQRGADDEMTTRTMYEGGTINLLLFECDQLGKCFIFQRSLIDFQRYSNFFDFEIIGFVDVQK